MRLMKPWPRPESTQPSMDAYDSDESSIFSTLLTLSSVAFRIERPVNAPPPLLAHQRRLSAGADTTVMRITDTAVRRHTAHLPYEVLVSGGRVTMLHGKFRIAQSYPDLTMGTFMKISGAPDGIAKVLGGLLK